MITIATTPTTQPAMTPATMEKSPLSVCVLLLLDGTTVGMVEPVALVDDCTIAVVVMDGVIEELGVLVGNFIVLVIGMPEDKVHGSS